MYLLLMGCPSWVHTIDLDIPCRFPSDVLFCFFSVLAIYFMFLYGQAMHMSYSYFDLLCLGMKNWSSMWQYYVLSLLKKLWQSHNHSIMRLLIMVLRGKLNFKINLYLKYSNISNIKLHLIMSSELDILLGFVYLNSP